ncbi:MAG TPA: hypothetical protein PKZ83_15790 [bacterium]|nr:hypothetical protein [bacterium]HQJ66487.1 hypothetical protein [bacterium]
MSEYKSMFEQAVRTLAAIDKALGIGDDGCGDPEQTIYAIADLKAAATRGEALAQSVMADHGNNREPLTSKQIRALEVEVAGSVLHNHPTDAEAFARAIERAHGIGTQP